jgi:biopolymer transport protein ExbD/DNA-directed RNA polymerase subunit RPC12/RpoP
VPITFRCSDCTQKLRIEDEFAGKKVTCVRCGSKQRVPNASSPEFLQRAAAPREPTAPESPAAPPKKQKPVEREPTSREPVTPKSPGRAQPERPQTRREPTPRESARSESPPPPAIWFQPIEVGDIEPPTMNLEPPDLDPSESFVSEPLFSNWDEPEPALLAPIAPEPAVSKSADPDQTLPVPALEPQRVPHEIRPQSRAPTPRARRPAARHVEPPLVPPYQKLDVEELIDMTAMVDIVFFLLIFFLVTSMHALDSTIPMPAPDPQKGAAREPRSVAAIDSDDSYVVVRVDRNDKIMVEGSEVRTDRELLFKLQDLRRTAAHPEKLLVVGHGDATHGTVVMVLDAGRELGMDQVRLTVQDEAD